MIHWPNHWIKYKTGLRGHTSIQLSFDSLMGGRSGSPHFSDVLSRIWDFGVACEMAFLKGIHAGHVKQRGGCLLSFFFLTDLPLSSREEDTSAWVCLVPQLMLVSSFRWADLQMVSLTTGPAFPGDQLTQLLYAVHTEREILPLANNILKGVYLLCGCEPASCTQLFNGSWWSQSLVVVNADIVHLLRWTVDLVDG